MESAPASRPPALPRRVFAGVLVVALAPVAYMLFRTAGAARDVAYWDEIDTVLEFLLRYTAAPDAYERLKVLFSLNNEHRMATSRALLVLSRALTGTVNLGLLGAVGVSFAVALAGLPPELPRIFFTLLCVSGFLWLFWRPLKISTFDEGFAQGLGIRTGALGMALVIVAAIAAVEHVIAAAAEERVASVEARESVGVVVAVAFQTILARQGQVFYMASQGVAHAGAHVVGVLSALGDPKLRAGGDTQRVAQGHIQARI